MNTPTLRSAIARQRWDVVAHLLVYGLIVVHTNGNGAIPPGGRGAMSPAPAAKLPAGYEGV
jgi:hypothetical protein